MVTIHDFCNAVDRNIFDVVFDSAGVVTVTTSPYTCQLTIAFDVEGGGVKKVLLPCDGCFTDRNGDEVIKLLTLTGLLVKNG